MENLVLTEEQANELALLAPKCTVSVIEDFEVVRKQLAFMKQATTDDAEPSADDREKTDLGPLAVRNFDDSYPDYATLLKALDYAFRRYDRLA